ncbi:MAG: site-specific DNA-methyltransferase [Candidatus Eisenbacteria bacterium]|nr:site-specific DNA-methyltransferase [Candidatus Eisenbacteria bacterium]
MKKLTAADPESRSPDLVAENVERLKTLFPELVTEGPTGAAVNVDVLKALVGDATVTDADEKYGLNWHGKRRARQLALTPSTGTLRPCPEDSVDWGTTQNLMIEGDNLEVLKLLQKSYAGKVKLIYIDPPYNTGKDFVYPDNFQDSIKNYLELTRQVEGGAKISSNTEASGRFHTDWLNMMYPRLRVARALLHQDGAILVSIGDAELLNLLAAMNDIFGDENQIAIFAWKSRAKPTNAGDAKYRPQKVAEYVVAYGRKPGDEHLLTVISSKQRTYPHEDNEGKYRTTTILTSNRGSFRRETMRFESGGYKPDEDNRWKAGKTVIDDLFARKRIQFNEEGIPLEKKYEHEEPEPLYPIYTFMDPDLTGTAESGKSDVNDLLGNQHGVDTVKPVDLMRYFVSTFANESDTVVDLFAGTGTTGHAVMELNADSARSRKFMLVQLPQMLDPENKDERTSALFCDSIGKPRTFSEITKERLRRAGKKIKDENPMFAGDLGFRVFKLDSSNICVWEPDRDDLDNTLLESVEHLKPGRTETDVLYELLLKLGLDLCVPIETRTLGGKDVQAIGGGVLMACLAEKIERSEVEALAQGIVEWHKALAPAGEITCVFRDSAFADDVTKTNLAAILEQHGIANVRSL